MQRTKVAVLILAIALALWILIPNLSWAEDGVSLRKAPYRVCDSADGAGKSSKPAAMFSSIAGDDHVIWERQGQQFQELCWDR